MISGSGQILLDGDVSDLRQWDLVGGFRPRSSAPSSAGPTGWRSWPWAVRSPRAATVSPGP